VTVSRRALLGGAAAAAVVAGRGTRARTRWSAPTAPPGPSPSPTSAGPSGSPATAASATVAERPLRTSTHGLGVELDQPWFMGRLSALTTFGHTGFTGTSILVEPRRRLGLVLLTNRAHPNWTWADPDPVRVAVADVIAGALR
jgi:CubicO group peptidase (beta-lactamase class C family)